MVTVGIVEGIAEATAAITKVFSGALSDYLGKRKFLLVFGYTLAAFTKPVFPLATSRRRSCVERPTDCAKHSIRSAHSSARCWQ